MTDPSFYFSKKHEESLIDSQTGGLWVLLLAAHGVGRRMRALASVSYSLFTDASSWRRGHSKREIKKPRSTPSPSTHTHCRFFHSGRQVVGLSTASGSHLIFTHATRTTTLNDIRRKGIKNLQSSCLFPSCGLWYLVPHPTTSKSHY